MTWRREIAAVLLTSGDNACSENGNWGNNYVLAAYGAFDVLPTAAEVAAARAPLNRSMPAALSDAASTTSQRTGRTRSGLPCAPDHFVCEDGLCCKKA